jgi:hypothetical protein
MLHWRDLGLKTNERSGMNVALGFFLGFGSLACVAVLAIVLGGRVLNPAFFSSQVIEHLVTAMIVAIIVAVIEEIVFRGALFGILRKAQSWLAALIISSAIYALAHFIHKAGSPNPVLWWSGLAMLPKMFQGGQPFVPAFLTLFVAGAVLALAYQRSGALFFSIGLHCGWIFWLKSYGLLTTSNPGANSYIWGTNTLIDGWLALPIMSCVLWIVFKMKFPAKNSEGRPG